MTAVPRIVAGLLVLALAAGAWLLLTDHPAPAASAPVTVAPAAVTSPPAPHALPAVNGELEPRLLASEGASPPAEGGPDAMPASYRAALAALVGRLVEEDGTPVPDLPVQLVGAGTHTLFPPSDLAWTEEGPALDVVRGGTTSDAEGRFRFDDVDPRTMGLLLVDPGGARPSLHLLEVTPVSGAVRDLGDIVLPGGVTVLGTVVDARGTPLPGVRVRGLDLPELGLAANTGVADFRADAGLLVEPEQQGSDLAPFVYRPPPHLARFERWLPLPTSITDAEGRFRLEAVRPGTVFVVADDAVRETLVRGPSVTGPAGGTVDLGTLTMQDGLPLAGVVVDERGEPLPGAQVMAGNRMTVGPVVVLRPPVVTDAEGRFAVTGLRRGPARAAVLPQGGRAWCVGPPSEAGDDRVRLVVPAPRRLLLTVAAEDGDGEPLPGAEFLWRALPDDDAEDMPDFLAPLRRAPEVGADEHGRYVLGGLPPSYVDVLVRAPGHAQRRVMADLRHGDGEERLLLQPELDLAVRVLREGSDEPVEWALVAVRTSERGVPAAATSGRTGHDGRVRLAGLPASEEAVCDVSHPALAMTSQEVALPHEGELIVRLPVGGTIVGRLLDRGAPPPEPLMVMLQREDDEWPLVMPQFALSGLDGAFRFENVEPGEVKLVARDRVQLSGFTTWWEPFAMTPLAEADVVVQAGREVETTLLVGSSYDGIETGTVSGRLLVNGLPAADWKVRTWGKIRRSVGTGPDGRFDMGRLAAGEVVLLFSPGAGRGMGGESVTSHTLQLLPGAHELVEVSVETGVVRGRVVADRTGQPLGGVGVRISEPEGSRQWWGRRGGSTTTQPDGSFAVEPVAAGTYVARAEAEGYAATTSAPFDVTGLGTTHGVEIRLRSALAVSGRLLLPPRDAPPRWLWLTAEAEDGTSAVARPDPAEFTFAFDDLAPGTWTFTLVGDTGGPLAPVTLVLSGPRDDLLLAFEHLPPEKEDAEAEEG